MAPANHWLFQLANVFLFLSFGSKDILLLRLLLMGAGVCFVLWGAIVLDVSVDTVVWNSMFTVINAVRAAEVVWSRRPIAFEREEHEEMYQELFGPVGIGRLQFKLLMEQGLLRKLRGGTTFLEAGNDASNLTLIFSGTMNIISAPKDGRPSEKVGTVERMQFVESPQWANMSFQRRKNRNKKQLRHEQSLQIATTTASLQDEEEGGSVTSETIFIDDEDVRAAAAVEVTFKAATDIVYYTWPMERLHDFLRRNPGLLAPVNFLVGADVASKLFRQSAAKKGEISALHRRVYLPMDEPVFEQPLLPVDKEDKTVRTGSLVADKKSLHTSLVKKETELGEVEDDDATTTTTTTDTTKTSTSPLEAERLWLERRGAMDTANDKHLASLLLNRTCLNKYELSALLAKGRWRSILRSGTVVIREGEPTRCLGIVLTGKLLASKEEIEDNGNGNGNGNGAPSSSSICKLHEILPGHMIGSIEFNEPERQHVAGETVTSLEPCTYMEWELDDLREFLGPRPRLRAQLTALVAADVAIKFRQVETIV